MKDSKNNTGHSNTGHSNTGHWNTGDSNTGHSNTGDMNTGHSNTGDMNTGDRNTGDRNTGDRNTGHWNTGDSNTGDSNTGDSNTGDSNTGDSNTGDSNTGHWNTGDRNTGFFNTTTPETIRVFDSEVSREEFDNWEKPNWLFFELTEWVSESAMTQEEKAGNPTYVCTQGYLKELDYKEAFQESYRKASREDQLKIKECPNFDADLFFEISGIRIDEVVKEMTLGEVCAELGREIKIVKTKREEGSSE